MTLVPVGEELSAQQAADILGVPRPRLIALLDGGEVDHVLDGRRRRIRAETLFSYRQARDARRGFGRIGGSGRRRRVVAFSDRSAAPDRAIIRAPETNPCPTR